MRSITKPPRTFAGVLVAAAGLTLGAGCRNSPALTAPSAVATPAPASSSVVFDASDTDSLVNGSEAQLTAFDTVTLLLSFNTTKGAFTALLDTSTVFRNAQTTKYSPLDPCRQFAIDYNTAGATVDTNGVFQAIAAMAGSGCLARIHTETTVTVPPNPIKSFRPLSAF
jgi:hypothetical protein